MIENTVVNPTESEAAAKRELEAIHLKIFNAMGQEIFDDLTSMEWECISGVIRRAKEEAIADYIDQSVPCEKEPLAVLADRKGFGCVRFDTYTDGTKSVYLLNANGVIQEKEFHAPTYAEAETLARQYLESLPDATKGE